MRADEIVDGYRGGMSDGYRSAGGEVYPRGEARCACPTCGQQMPTAEIDLLRLVETVVVTPRRQAILDCLIEAYPVQLTVQQIAAAVYGKASAKTMRSVRTLVCMLRDDIAPYGWMIPLSKPGRGAPGYRLKSKIKRK